MGASYKLEVEKGSVPTTGGVTTRGVITVGETVGVTIDR